MTPPFVPLAPPGCANPERAAAATQLRLLSVPAAAGPMGSATQPAMPAAHLAVGTAAPLQNGHCATPPTLTLQREGDRIVGIRIQCSCGQPIELECTYP